MPTYDVAAIDACMQKAQDYKGRFGEVSDTFPEMCGTPAAYGTLPSSATLSSAVDSLNDVMHDELAAAENRLEGVARALDAISVSVENTEQERVDGFTAARP